MHFGGHWREAFCDWVDAGCPAEVELEVSYEPTTWDRRRFLGKMSHCSDVLPQETSASLCERFPQLEDGRRSYAAAAQFILANLAQPASATERRYVRWSGAGCARTGCGEWPPGKTA